MKTFVIFKKTYCATNFSKQFVELCLKLLWPLLFRLCLVAAETENGTEVNAVSVKLQVHANNLLLLQTSSYFNKYSLYKL